MTREQAINYLISSGFTHEQVGDVVRALTYEPTTKNNLGVDKFDKAINQSDLEEWIMETFPDWCEGDVRLIMNHMDEMPSATPQLSVPEVTALAEWTEKLTEASEDAYNKGYADGMKAQAEPKTKIEESNFSREQYALDIDTAWKCGYEAGQKENSPINICPHCGEYIGEEE